MKDKNLGGKEAHHMTTKNDSLTANGLPPRAKLLSPIVTKSTGGWVTMQFDASIKVFGMTWLRVKDGMGGGGNREDWVADIPGVSISIHDYHWNGREFGPNHGSFLGAIKAETKNALQYAINEERKLLSKARKQARGIAFIRKALKKAT